MSAFIILKTGLDMIIKGYSYTKLVWNYVPTRTNINCINRQNGLNDFLKNNYVCILENFNTKISHQPFKYTITFVNSKRDNTNSIFYSKTGLKRLF